MANQGSARLEIHEGTVVGGFFRYVPVFLVILVLYIVGYRLFPDPRTTIVAYGPYHLSWVEVLLVIATVLSLFEQMKVSHPGIDNTIEALFMVGMGVLQLVLFVLGVNNEKSFFAMFNTTEFLVLTFISIMAAVVAVLINARTLRRTIGVGDN
ncbi:MAG: hypothetical protein U1E87_05905 [Alphaproteobacteria bacterium]